MARLDAGKDFIRASGQGQNVCRNAADVGKPTIGICSNGKPHTNKYCCSKYRSSKQNCKKYFSSWAESYPSYPSVSDTVEVETVASPVDKFVDNPVDNVPSCEHATSEQVNTLYQQTCDFSRTHSIAEVHEDPSVAESDAWFSTQDFSAQDDHPAERSYADCWIPQHPRKDSRFDARYPFDSFMQKARQSYTCSRYSPHEYSYVQRLIRERVCYDEMCEQYGPERVDMVVDILMEINSAVGGTFRVEQIEISARDMKAHFAKINQFHVQHMFANLDKHYERIKCVKSYMRTTLYNAIIAMNEEIREQIRQDCPWLFLKKEIQPIQEESESLLAAPATVVAAPAYVCA